eukprot:1159779-Pelagomonas_calceolata.AAC.11
MAHGVCTCACAMPAILPLLLLLCASMCNKGLQAWCTFALTSTLSHGYQLRQAPVGKLHESSISDAGKPISVASFLGSFLRKESSHHTAMTQQGALVAPKELLLLGVQTGSQLWSWHCVL